MLEMTGTKFGCGMALCGAHNSGMPGDTLKRAMSLMTNHRLRHLLVIGKLGRTSLASRTRKSGGT